MTPSQSSPRQDVRARLICLGLEILSEQGFGATGLEQLVREAGIPKGSFYYYFKSKNDFGLQVIDSYAEIWEKKLVRLLCDASVTPLHRLSNYIDEAIAGLEKYQFRRGCLMGDLGQELAGLDEVFRLRIAAVFERWTELLSMCLREAQACGELDARLDGTAIADFFWTSWEGAILRAKLDRSTRAVLQFRQMLFDHVLSVRR